MKRDIPMPALSDTMSNGRLVRWLKQEGGPVKRGEVIAEVETDKAIMDVEAFHDGYLCGPLTPADTEIPVGQTIGYLVDTPAEVHASPVATPSHVDSTVAAGSQSSSGSAAGVAAASPSPAQRPRSADQGSQASPYARTLAGRLGVDLGKVAAGAAPIRAEDVLAAAQNTTPPGELKAGPPYRLERNSSFREATARAMIASLATPMFHVTSALSLGALIARAKKDDRSVNLLLARACALSIAEHPRFNALYTPQGIAFRERVDIGIAVESLEGLITPVLRDVVNRSLADLSANWSALLEKARSRRLLPAEYGGASFYISDLGVFPGIYNFDSIIPQGAAALLSVAAAQGEKTLCTLNCDHRVVFGGDAARFLETLAKYIASISESGG